MLYNQIVPEEKIEKLKKKNIIADSDDVCLFFDNSTFLNAKKGIVCTKKYLICFDSKTINRYKYEDIDSLIFEEVDKESYTYKIILKLKSNELKDITPKSTPNDEMKLIVDIFNKDILHR
ncbi:MAG: hypothetical protein J1G30_06800 [Spirochaetales bacterium]|nr:hypothetical protein [Spirochaetales bacterium]